MPPSPALTTKQASSRLTSLAWFVFKLSFGLFSLATTWATVAWKNGVFQPKDTDEEKEELEKGTWIFCRAEVRLVLRRSSPGEVLES